MIDGASNPKQDFNWLYSDVSGSIAAALAEIDKLEVDHKNGKQEIGNILERLRGMQARFDDELGLLEKHAEWEKFTIAFFGETNAGKSTIVESLRILFKEESRQQLLDQNARELSRYEQELASHVDAVREGLVQAHAAYAADISAVRRDIDSRVRSLLDESAARTASFRQEATTLERALQEETVNRNRLEQLLARAQEDNLSARKLFEEALARAKLKAWLALVAGCVFGGAVLGMIALVWN